MNSEIIILSALLSLNIVIGFKAVRSYGRAKYLRGKLDGFNEFVEINKEVCKKFKETKDE